MSRPVDPIGAEPCPVPGCGSLSAFEPAETVDVGVGEVPIGPDEWTCPLHGRWCYMPDHEARDAGVIKMVLVVEHPRQDDPLEPSRFAEPDAPCPVAGCGRLSAHQLPELFHNGVGLQPLEPSSWDCPVHGRWDNEGPEGHPRIQHPGGRPPPLTPAEMAAFGLPF